MAAERIDVTLELHDALSRPAGRAEEALDDLGDSAEKLAAKEALATEETKRLDRALGALHRASGQADTSIGRTSAAYKANAAAADSSTKSTDKNSKASKKAAEGFDILKKVMGAVKWSAFALAANLAAGAVSAVGAAGFAAVAGLAPLVGVLGAVPALLGAVLGAAAAVKLGFSGIGAGVKALTSGKTTLEQQADALSKLSPAGQSFVMTLADLKKRTDGWRDAIQAAMLPKFEKGLYHIAAVMPIIRKGLVLNAAAVGHLGNRLGVVVGGSGRDFEKIFKSNDRIIRRGLTPALTSFVHIFLDFMVAGSPLANRFAEWLGESAKNLQHMVDNGRRTGDLQAFLHRAGNLAADLGGFIADVAVALFNTGKASKSLSRDMGGGLLELASDWRKWTESVSGQNAIKQWFKDAQPVMSALWDTVTILGKAFTDLSHSGNLAALITQINTQLIPALLDLANGAASQLGGALVTAATAFVKFQSLLSFSPLAQALTLIADAANFLLDVLHNLPGPLKFAVATLVTLSLTVSAVSKAFALLKASAIVSQFTSISAGAKNAATNLNLVSDGAHKAESKLGLMTKTGLGIVGVAMIVGQLVDKLGRVDTSNLEADLTALGRGETTDHITGIVDSLHMLEDKTNNIDLGEIVTAGGLFGDDTLDKAGQNVQALDDQLAQMVETGDKVGAQKLYEDFAKLAEQAGVSTQKTGTYFESYQLALRNAAPRLDALTLASQRAVNGSDRFSHAEKEAASQANAAAAAADKHRHAAVKLNDELIGEQRTWIGYRQNIADAKKTLTDGRLTLNTYTQAGRDNKSALLDVAEAASAVEDKAGRTAAIKEARGFISRWADAAGMGKKAADKYADSLFNLTGKAKNVPKKVPVDVEVTGIDTVLGRMADLDAYADQLNGRVIHMETRLDGTGTPARKDGGAVWQMQDFRVGEVGPEMFVGLSGNVGVIGAAGPTTMQFSEPGVVIPNDAMPAWVTDRLERPVYADATVASGAAGESTPDVHLHFHGDGSNPTPDELEAIIMRAWRRYERERKERS